MQYMQSCQRRLGVAFAGPLVMALGAAFGVPANATNAQPATAPPQPDRVLLDRTTRAAVGFLRSYGQASDGSYSSFSGPGITAIVTTALLRNGLAAADPMVAQGLRYLESFTRDDGGVYQEGTLYPNYETCLAMVCFAEANHDGRYDELLKKADRFVKDLQWDARRGHDLTSTSYGGAGYGNHRRPDLSNTSFLIDALKAAGNGPEDEAVQKALVFVSRCQNLESQHNTTQFAALDPDGGFYYTCAAGGASQAGETANGGLRSYGSMTYAGLKSMIYAGVGPDDPRVQAAYRWIRQHYSLDENPGLGDAGLYYYYHTFAKALSATGKNLIEDGDGRTRDWRYDLVRALAQRQQRNGSWVNGNHRWLEGDPNLVTAYALLALSYCRPATPAPSTGGLQEH